MKNMTLIEFLGLLSIADTDTALELVEKFQAGRLSVAGFSVNDI